MNTGQTSKNIFTYPTYVFVIFISVFFLPTTFSLQGKISIGKIDIFSTYKWHPFLFDQTSQIIFAIKNEQIFEITWKTSTRSSHRRKKMKYFISKVSIWDYFSLTEQDYKYSLVKEKANFLNRYYRELYQKHYEPRNFYLFFILSGCLLSAIFCLCLTMIFFLMVF